MAQESKVEYLVLDSSIIIKWFCDEEGTEKALKIRKRYKEKEVVIVVPDLILYEISNALRYNKEVSREEVMECVQSIFSLGINIIVPTKEVLENAISLAFKYNISLYDAYFVALADILQFTFVTADKKLFNKLDRSQRIKLLDDMG